jgi:hypothetical protein
MAKKKKSNQRVVKGRDYRTSKSRDGLRKAKVFGYRFSGDIRRRPTVKEIEHHNKLKREGKESNIYFEGRIERADRSGNAPRGLRYSSGGNVGIREQQEEAKKNGYTLKAWRKLSKGGDIWTALDFENIEQYFDYINDSFINGNHSQVKKLYNDMSEAQRERFFAYTQVQQGSFDEVVKYINKNVRKFKKGGGVGKDARLLAEKEKFELKVLQGLGGWNDGQTLNGLLESMGLSNYRFSKNASEIEVNKVKKALNSLIKKEYVEESGLGYKSTQIGADYLRSFDYGTYAKGGGIGSLFGKLKADTKSAYEKTKAGTKEAYEKSKEYTKKQIHDQKKKIALEVIDDTKDKVISSKTKVALKGAKEIVKDKYEGGGSVGSEEKSVREILNSKGAILCGELEDIIGREPCYPVCKVGSITLRKKFMCGYEEI